MAIQPQVGFGLDFYTSSIILYRQYYYTAYAGLGLFQKGYNEKEGIQYEEIFSLVRLEAKL